MSTAWHRPGRRRGLQDKTWSNGPLAPCHAHDVGATRRALLVQDASARGQPAHQQLGRALGEAIRDLARPCQSGQRVATAAIGLPDGRGRRHSMLRARRGDRAHPTIQVERSVACFAAVLAPASTDPGIWAQLALAHVARAHSLHRVGRSRARAAMPVFSLLCFRHTTSFVRILPFVWSLCRPKFGKGACLVAGQRCTDHPVQAQELYCVPLDECPRMRMKRTIVVSSSRPYRFEYTGIWRNGRHPPEPRGSNCRRCRHLANRGGRAARSWRALAHDCAECGNMRPPCLACLPL